MFFAAGRAAREPAVCQDCPNRDCTTLFADLGRADRAELRHIMSSLRYDEGDPLFRENTPVFGFYIICAGKVKLVKTDRSQHRMIFKIVGPTGVVGEEDLFNEQGYTTTAQALEPTLVKFIKREDFIHFVRLHPELTLKLAEQLSREVKGFQAKVMEASYEEVKGRMARILLLLSDRYGQERDGEGLAIGLELSRADLAEMAGISTETAIRTLREFMDRGLIRLEKRAILIRDRPALEGLVEPFPTSFEEMLL